MILRRREYLPPRISRQGQKKACKYGSKGKREEAGQIEWLMSLFLLLLFGILLNFGLQIAAYRASSLYLEDALAASNLASAVIDWEEYGRTHTLLIRDPQEAYERFCTAVRENLHLNEAWEGSNKALITGKVQVESYIIYNVKQDIVTVQELNAGAVVSQWQGRLGNVRAPNGTLIESTGIYSELSFPIEGLLGVEVQAHKGQLADVIAEGNSQP